MKKTFILLATSVLIFSLFSCTQSENQECGDQRIAGPTFQDMDEFNNLAGKCGGDISCLTKYFVFDGNANFRISLTVNNVCKSDKPVINVSCVLLQPASDVDFFARAWAGTKASVVIPLHTNIAVTSGSLDFDVSSFDYFNVEFSIGFKTSGTREKDEKYFYSNLSYMDISALYHIPK